MNKTFIRPWQLKNAPRKKLNTQLYIQGNPPLSSIKRYKTITIKVMNVLRTYLGGFRGDPAAGARRGNGKLLICKVASSPHWSQKTKKYFTRVMDWSELQTFHIQQVFEQIYL